MSFIFRLVTLPLFLVIMVPLFLYKLFKYEIERDDFSASVSRAPKFFRGLTDIMGTPQIPGIGQLSDFHIKSRYSQIRKGLEAVAVRRNEKIPKSVINGIVRDTLIEDIEDLELSEIDISLKFLNYEQFGIEMVMVKGRLYV